MPNVSSFGAQTDNSVVQGTVTDRAMVIPDIPPQGLMSIGPRVTPHFVKPSLWSALTTYHFFDAVHDASGASYVAIKPEVPAGTELTDEGYWFLWADPNSQFADLSELVKTFDGRIAKNADDIAVEIARATEAEKLIKDTYMASVRTQSELKAVTVEPGKQVMCNGALFTISAAPDQTRYNVPLTNGNYAVYTPYNGIADMTVLGATTAHECADEINAAFELTGYDHFFFPDGTYAVAKTILMKRNYVTIEGSIAPSPTSGPSDSCKGSTLKWVGNFTPDMPIMLVNPKGGFAIETDFPTRGATIKRLSFDGNQLAGYGLFVPFMAYSGSIDEIYAQGCVSAGIVIAQSWMVDNGEINAWYNGIGILIGMDEQAQNHSIFQTNFSFINGHNSTVMLNGSSALSNFRGTGVVIRKQGASHIDLLDAESNESCGLDVDAYQGLVINSVWCERNSETGTNGVAIKSDGSLNIGSLVLSAQDKVINNGYLRIDSIASDVSYYPFEGSAENSISVGICKYELRKDQDLSKWTALITKLIDHAVFRDIHTNSLSYGNYFQIPKNEASSVVIVPLETKTCEQFVINFGSKTITIPSADWTTGSQMITPNYTSETDVNDDFTQLYIGVPSTTDLKIDIHLMSIQYFTDMPLSQLPRKAL